MPIINYEKWGMRLLRIGLALVFLWFGIQQLMNPGDWIGYVPDIASKFFLNTTQIVLINGLFEVVASVLLILNVYAWLAALLLGLHMLGISFSIGINPIGVRDIGISVGTLALALLSPKKF